MMKQLFNDMVSNLEARLLTHFTARQRFTLEVSRLGQRFYSGANRLAWCGVYVPFDLFS